MRTFWPMKLISLLAVITLCEHAIDHSAAAGPFFHGHTQVATGQTYVVVPTTQTAVPHNVGVVQSTAVSGVMYIPAAVAPTRASSVGATYQQFQVNPAVGSAATYYYIVPGTAAQSGNARVASSVFADPTLGTSSGPGSDTDYHVQVIQNGFFGGSFSKTQGFLAMLKQTLADLTKKNPNLGQSQLTTLLMDAAKTYLSSTGLGFVAEDLEPILAKIIGKLFTNGTPGGDTPQGDTSPSTPQINIPSGGLSFSVSGTIVLTPTNGGPGDKQVVIPDGQQNPGKLPSLLPEQDGAEPASPPSR